MMRVSRYCLGAVTAPAAWIVPILHAFLKESIPRLALQSLLVRTELAVLFCFEGWL